MYLKFSSRRFRAHQDQLVQKEKVVLLATLLSNQDLQDYLENPASEHIFSNRFSSFSTFDIFLMIVINEKNSISPVVFSSSSFQVFKLILMLFSAF